MPDDNQIQEVTAPIVPADSPEETKTTETSEITSSVTSSQPNGSNPSDLPPEAQKSPANDSVIIPVESDNLGPNQPESDTPEPQKVAEIPESGQFQAEPNPESVQMDLTQPPPSVPAALTPPAPQPQSPAQQDQTGFIRALLAKAQVKIQFNKQKKLDKIMLFAQKKKIIANEDVQLFLHVSSATATRYLVKLVQQGQLARVGSPRDAKYQFLH